MNALLRFIEANGLNSQTIESLPASELDHLLSMFFFMNVRRKNGEYEPATFSSFQCNMQQCLSEKKYPFNILKDNEFEKSRRVLAAKHKSLVHEHDRRNKLQAAQAIDENEEDALLRQENSATPIQLHFKELCGGFHPYTSVSEPEMRAMRTTDLMLLLLKLNTIFTATFS